jgi:hypothetical protein
VHVNLGVGAGVSADIVVGVGIMRRDGAKVGAESQCEWASAQASDEWVHVNLGVGAGVSADIVEGIGIMHRDGAKVGAESLRVCHDGE